MMNTFFSKLDNEEIFSIFNKIYTNLYEGVIIINEHNRIQAVNPAFSLITGYFAKDVIGKRPWFLKSNQHNRQFYKSMIFELTKFGRWKGDIWSRRKNGEICLVELSIIALEKNHKQFYIGIFSEYAKSGKVFTRKSNIDPLTNLPSRMIFQDRLSFMLAHARRNDQIVALLLLDINRFKVMNDTLGFNIGDMILMTTAKRLKKVLREVDGLFRLGNDEFAIILEEVSKIEDTARVAKKILSTFNTPYRFPAYKDDIYLSANIGISVFPQDGSTFEIIIKNAETAMYRAKELEQNHFQHYSPTMNARSFEHITLEHQLHRAVDQQEFIIYYQPFIDIKTNTIIGAEALIRWQHPELGLVSPAVFIPLAEETGLIIPIGDFVLREACEKAKSWQENINSSFFISVNLSTRQFEQHDLIQKIEIILANTKLSPYSLELEITESISMSDAEKTIMTMNELKERGIRISIDDFGTGYSSLSYLRKFPIDTLKIDQSFVRDIGQDQDSETIISLIISMAHTLKLEVIAEGVETPPQLDFLRDQQCDSLQGYIVSKPIPASQFEMLLMANKLKGKNQQKLLVGKIN